eukprot:4839201-Amphidinium_carterae.1
MIPQPHFWGCRVLVNQEILYEVSTVTSTMRVSFRIGATHCMKLIDANTKTKNPTTVAQITDLKPGDDGKDWGLQDI